MRTTTTATRSTDWWQRAACTAEDPELFFPVSTEGPGQREREQAKQVCRRCPVTAECLSWALQLGRPAGIWGGMDEDERARLTAGRRSHGRGRSRSGGAGHGGGHGHGNSHSQSGGGGAGRRGEDAA